MSSGTIITFYSYKGGVGRTLALANVGALLSLWGYKVLCVDWDLEAPGLHLYFDRWIDDRSAPGLVELVESCAADCDADWHNHVTPVKLPEAAGSLDLIAAGRFDESYVRRMQELDWETLYSKHRLGEWIESLRNAWKEAYDFILIDSRTGVTDIGGICTIQMPDQLVLLFTANHQNLQGVMDVARRAAERRNRLPFDRASVPCVPVPTRFEGRVESELAKEWLDIFAETLDPLYRQWADASVQPRQLLDLIRIPYVAFWSFGEKLPVIDEGTRDPESIGFAFETLTALLVHGLAKTDLLLQSRDDFAALARPEDLRDFLYDAFITYQPTVSELAQKVDFGLTRRGLKVYTSRDLAGGPNWNRIAETLIKSRNFIVVFDTGTPEIVQAAILGALFTEPKLGHTVLVSEKGTPPKGLPESLQSLPSFGINDLDRIALLLATPNYRGNLKQK